MVYNFIKLVVSFEIKTQYCITFDWVISLISQGCSLITQK